MSYLTTNLSVVDQTIEGNLKEWLYLTSDSMAAVLATGYFTDAASKRLNVGDVVFVLSGTLNAGTTTEGGEVFPATLGVTGFFSGAPSWQPCVVQSVNAAGAATVVATSLPASAGQNNFRNIIDGGDFTTNPWQRGPTFTGITSTVTYTADRFFAVGGASSSISVSKTANTTVPGFSQSLVWGRASTNTNTAQINLGQVLETADSIRMQGQPVTLSFWAAAGANFSAAALNVQLIYGTGTDQSAANMIAGSWTTQGNVINASQALTTTLTRYTFTGLVPVGATQLGLQFSYVPVGTAGANDNVIFEGIQLEAGSQSTAFEHRDIQVELEICQRYAWVINEPAANVIVGSGMNTTTAVQVFYMATPVQFRVAPTVTIVAAGTFKTNQSGTATATTVTAGTTHTPNAISINGNSAGTAGQGTLLQGGGGAGVIVASADY